MLDSLVHYDSVIASLSIALGHDASGFDPDAPLPEIPESSARKNGRERAIALARHEYEGATLRENLGLPRPQNRYFQTRSG